MIPLSKLSFCNGEELKPGDFAYVEAFNNRPALVGLGPDDEIVAVDISDVSTELNFISLGSLVGVAAKVEDFFFEVDPETGNHSGTSVSVFGDIFLKYGHLHITAKSLRGGYPVKLIAFEREIPEHRTLVFPVWRIATKIGDQLHILFESSPI